MAVADGSSGIFKKASDTDLRQAAMFIEEKNIAKLATKYLGLSSKQISGRDVFGVLKLWRDAVPFQGFKEVRFHYLSFFFHLWDLCWS